MSKMFNTYIINLDRSKDRWQKIKKRMKETDLKDRLYRFRAVDGSYVSERLNERVDSVCQKFCPLSTIGCGLSHLELIRYIYDNDPYPYALILEDDVFPVRKDLSAEIAAIASAYHDWDIIRFICIGFCPTTDEYNTFSKLFSGSAAAYIISKQAQKKLYDAKVHYHIDLQQNWTVKIYYVKEPKLFDVNVEDTGSSQTQFTGPIMYYLTMPLARVGKFNICGLYVLIAIILVVAFYYTKRMYM